MQSLETTKTELFGQLDAFDENDEVFENYFLETNIYKKIKGKEKFYIIVGEKGTGKSALLKMCMINNEKNEEVVVDIKRPQITEKVQVSKLVDLWKDSLSKNIVDEIEKKRERITDSKKVNTLFKGIEAIASPIIENKTNINYWEIKKYVFDFFEKENRTINIYIDDLDVGYRNTSEQNDSIAALFTAIREMLRENKALKVRMTLRTDVYDNVRRTDESSDKIQNNRIDLKITNHEILAMLVKRVLSFWGDNTQDNFMALNQDNMMGKIDGLIAPIYHGKGNWENKPMRYILMTLTRRRPRDIFALCGLAWDHAVENGRIKIETDDINAVIVQYSNERLRDIISEYQYEFRKSEDLKEVILSLKTSETDRKRLSQSYLYTRDELFKKIDSILERTGKVLSSDGNIMETDALAKILYKANIITGRKDLQDSIERIYYAEYPDLIRKVTDIGVKYEVHPAYRWAIDVQDNKILNSVDCERL